MTRIEDDVLIIEDEPIGKCELCGVEEETRPYGPNGEQICFDCGQKDLATTIKKFYERKGYRQFKVVE